MRKKGGEKKIIHENLMNLSVASVNCRIDVEKCF